MASNVTFDSSFPDDTEEGNRATKTLEDLVNGSIEPSYAAEIIDKINIDHIKLITSLTYLCQALSQSKS